MARRRSTRSTDVTDEVIGAVAKFAVLGVIGLVVAGAGAAVRSWLAIWWPLFALARTAVAAMDSGTQHHTEHHVLHGLVDRSSAVRSEVLAAARDHTTAYPR